MDVEESALEHLLFGTELPVDHIEFDEDSRPDEALFTIDAGTKKRPLAAVWVDEEDDRLIVDISSINRLKKLRTNEKETKVTAREFQQRLAHQFEKTSGKPEWAKLVEEGEPSLEFLKSTLGIALKLSKSSNLNQSMLEVVRVKDANITDQAKCVIQASLFHPSKPVLMTAGFDKMIRLFTVDGTANAKIQSLHFKDMPIFSAAFTVDGLQIIASGRRSYFYVFDIATEKIERIGRITGRDEKSLERMKVTPCNRYIAFIGDAGTIILVCRTTKQWVANLKMNCLVADICFSKDGLYCYSLGVTGEIFQWSLETHTVIRIGIDAGAIQSTVMQISPNNEFIAVGSKSGIVNIYNTKSSFSHASSAPTRIVPVKTLDNLTTSIHSLTFNPTSQLLVFASRRKKDAMRVCHLPSFKVFKNWPTANTPLSSVNTVAFSQTGEYLSVGNEKGKVLLYKLTAFGK